MTLDEFNALDDAAAAELLGHCCAANRWIHGMLARRPFSTPADLVEDACEVWEMMGVADWLLAFDAHPKIGDVDSLREKYAATKAMAGSEQGAVADADEETLHALARLNHEYEERFGFIFIVFATGKSASDMLALLRSRINNSREAELQNAAAEQLKITLLRLERAIA